MKVGDIVKIKKESEWLDYRPELTDVPMTVIKIHNEVSGSTIAVRTTHGISKWKAGTLEIINESR